MKSLAFCVFRLLLFLFCVVLSVNCVPVFGRLIEATLSTQEKSVLNDADDEYELIDMEGRVLKARILNVEEDVVFIRRSDGRNFQLPLNRLSDSTVSLLTEWKRKFTRPLTDKQRAYFDAIGKKNSSDDVKDKSVSKTIQPFLKRPDPDKQWILDQELSDEFSSKKVNTRKWIDNMPPWGDRAWASENIFQKDGSLFVQATHEPHLQGNIEYFYKLGILQSRKKVTYGYFEARIKGCSRFPGVCPAFWLYSNQGERNPDFPRVAYCEIDVVEMLQGLYDPDLKRETKVDHIDCNLHCRLIDKSGKEVWVRPNDSPKLCKHSWNAPWDPRDDYHVYGCENAPEKVTWYIDGKRVAYEKNLYWHLPMSVALTMELRPPFIDWVGVDGRAPVKASTTTEGFPTEMAVDYVRCWSLKK